MSTRWCATVAAQASMTMTLFKLIHTLRVQEKHAHRGRNKTLHGWWPSLGSHVNCKPLILGLREKWQLVDSPEDMGWWTVAAELQDKQSQPGDLCWAGPIALEASHQCEGTHEHGKTHGSCHLEAGNSQLPPIYCQWCWHHQVCLSHFPFLLTRRAVFITRWLQYFNFSHIMKERGEKWRD